MVTINDLVEKAWNNHPGNKEGAVADLAKDLHSYSVKDSIIFEAVCKVAAGQYIQTHSHTIREHSKMTEEEKETYIKVANAKGNESAKVLAQTIFDYTLFNGISLGDATKGILEEQAEIFKKKVAGHAPQALWFKALASVLPNGKVTVHKHFKGDEEKVLALQQKASAQANQILKGF